MKEEIKKYLTKYYVLYQYDVENILNTLIEKSGFCEKIKENNKTQVENIIKFLDNILFIIDYKFFDKKGLRFAFEDFDYVATPSFDRVNIIITLFREEIINLEDIINNYELTNRELINQWNLSKIKSIEDTNAIMERIPLIPEMMNYCTEALSELCYLNLRKLSLQHLFDFKKDCLKLTRAILKLKQDEKKELFYYLLNSSTYKKVLLLSDPFLQNYSFGNNKDGKGWESIYNLLKENVI